MSNWPTEGRISVHPRGFGFVEPDDGDAPAFVAPPDMNRLLAGDRVSANIAEGPDGRLSASNVKLLSRSRTELFGTVVLRQKRAFLHVDRTVANTDWPLEGDVPAAGTAVVAKIGDGVLKVLRQVAATDASLERVVVRHGLRTVFSPACIAAAASAKLKSTAGRRDLRALPTVTIDAPSTRDLDDALAVLPAGPDGALRLFVSIADVDSLVPEGSPLDEEARLRATSVYLAGRVLPMLPESLSEKGLSLLPGEERPAMTVELRIDPEGAVTSTDVYESLIRSHARLDYDGVAAFLDGRDTSGVAEPVRETVRWLRTAAARISATRAARGGVSLLREEAYVTLDATTREPVRVEAREDTSAHRLVERLMVAANEAVARWLVERGLPGAFRVHDEPEPDRVEALASFARNVGFEAGFSRTLTPRALAAFEAQFASSRASAAMYTMLGRALGPARYTVTPSMHFGIAAPLYTHFTSPIRRYPDVIVHRVVKRYLAGARDQIAGDENIETICQHVNAAARAATKAEEERLRMLAARLFAGRVGERFAGNIVAIKPFGLVVQLAQVGVSGTVATETLEGGPYRVDPAREALVSEARAFTVGEPLTVEVLGASEELGRIELGVVKQP